jgi:hypothetical protein
MEITRKAKTEDVDTLEDAPEEKEPDAIEEPQPSKRERELELQLARQEGEMSAMKRLNTNTGQPSLEQTKQIVLNDANTLSDEDFHRKYPQHTKHTAIMTVMDADNRQTKAEARQLHAEASAAAKLSAKYGAAYYDVESKIREGMEDLSPEARQDAEKLSRYMERQFLALSRGSITPKTKSDDRRKVVSDFEKPTIQAKKEIAPIDNGDEDEIKDEVPEGSDISSQKLAAFLNIRSAKEQKDIIAKWHPGTEKGETVAYVDMDLTCKDPYAKEKIIFNDPKRGFERVKVVA